MNLSTNPTSSLFRHASHGWIHHPSVGWCLLFRWFGAAPGGSTRTAKSAEHFPTREDSGDTFHSRKPSPSSVCLKMNTMDSISEYHETDHDILLLQNHSRVPTRVEILMSQPTSLLRDVPSRSQCPEKPYVLSHPECQPWAPGQHFLLSIPSINKFTSHLFTVGSICDQKLRAPPADSRYSPPAPRLDGPGPLGTPSSLSG